MSDLIQKCKQGHKYVANSHEYPCPWCEYRKAMDIAEELHHAIHPFALLAVKLHNYPDKEIYSVDGDKIVDKEDLDKAFVAFDKNAIKIEFRDFGPTEPLDMIDIDKGQEPFDIFEYDYVIKVLKARIDHFIDLIDYKYESFHFYFRNYGTEESFLKILYNDDEHGLIDITNLPGPWWILARRAIIDIEKNMKTKAETEKETADKIAKKIWKKLNQEAISYE